MEIKRNGTQQLSQGASGNFTGGASIQPVFQIGDPARIRAASVTFEPAARTVWHTHPCGQILIITAGIGLVQSWGGAVEQVTPGDVVWFAPEEKHWHGASPTSAMTHIGISELTVEGKSVDWLEPVSDAQYSTEQ